MRSATSVIASRDRSSNPIGAQLFRLLLDVGKKCWQFIVRGQHSGYAGTQHKATLIYSGLLWSACDGYFMTVGRRWFPDNGWPMMID